VSFGHIKVKIEGAIADVRMPILSVARLYRKGISLMLDAPACSMLLGVPKNTSIAVAIERNMFVVKGRLHDEQQQSVEILPVEDLRSCCGTQLPDGWEPAPAEAARQPATLPPQSTTSPPQLAQTPIVEDRTCSDAPTTSAVVIPAPEAPLLKDQLQHAVTHVPFAPWCSVCIQAKSREDSHHTAKPQERIGQSVDEPPELQVDLTFVDGVPILAAYCTERSYGVATVLKNKEIDDYMVQWTLKALDVMGLERAVVIVDPDPVMLGLRDRMHHLAPLKVLMRETSRRSKEALE
jgi:hypothetical protein